MVACISFQAINQKMCNISVRVLRFEKTETRYPTRSSLVLTFFFYPNRTGKPNWVTRVRSGSRVCPRPWAPLKHSMYWFFFMEITYWCLCIMQYVTNIRREISYNINFLVNALILYNEMLPFWCTKTLVLYTLMLRFKKRSLY